MNKDDFLNLIIHVIETRMPGVQAFPVDDEFKIKIVKNGHDYDLNLDNIYRDYLKINSEDAFDSVVSFLNDVDDYDESTVLVSHQDKLIPHIRKVFDEDIKEKFVLVPINEEIEMCFALDFPDHVRYVSTSMLNDFFTSDKVKRVSFENMLNRGWLNDIKDEHSGAGKMMMFKNEEHIYQGQFFIPEMTQGFLSDEFYFILPARSVTVVLIPNNINKNAVLEGILKLKEFAVKIYSNEAHNISEKVFHSKNGEVEIVG